MLALVPLAARTGLGDKRVVRLRLPVHPAFGAIVVLATLAACARARPDPSASDDGGAGASDETTSADLTDDGARDAAATPNDPKAIANAITLHAITAEAPVFSATEFPAKDPEHAAAERRGVVRLGHLRYGGTALAKPDVIKKASCAEGWYALLAGGFVCGKFVTTDANAKALRYAPHAPFMDRPLPYDYGLNLTPGTPLYRRIPLVRERKEEEKTLAVGKGASPAEVAKKLRESGEEVPAYLKDLDAKPHVGFDDLKGESGALVAQRMLKGFYLALDQKVEAHSGTFWRTTNGYVTPKAHIIVHESKTEFKGVELAAPGETRKLPLAFVVGTRARETEIDGNETHRHEHIERFSILQLTGKHQRVDGHRYWETDQGFWVRDIDVAVVDMPKQPADIDVAHGEKWIDVDLSAQSLVALEGDKAVYATIVSTGRHDADPEKDHTTPAGSYRIREKHVTTTMDDDAATDGTYRIEDVPWVMYFDKSIALHGAFWHSGFGRERSHGCVNLTPDGAKHVFEWAGPKLPDGWHGVRATNDNPGTRVIVHP